MAWPEDVAGRRGRKAWPKGVAGRRGPNKNRMVRKRSSSSTLGVVLPDAPMCPARCSCAVHPSADSDTRASLSRAADIAVRDVGKITSTSRLQQLQCTHLARIHTSSRAKVPPADATLALDLIFERLNSCVTRARTLPTLESEKANTSV